jgi:hypothetical protein
MDTVIQQAGGMTILMRQEMKYYEIISPFPPTPTQYMEGTAT